MCYLYSIQVPKYKSQESVYPYGLNHSYQILVESKGKFQYKGIYKERDNMVIVLFASFLGFQPRSHMRIIPGILSLATWPSPYGARFSKFLAMCNKTIMVCQVMFLRPMRYSGYGASLGGDTAICNKAGWPNEVQL
jgi:hypothetical protein